MGQNRFDLHRYRSKKLLWREGDIGLVAWSQAQRTETRRLKMVWCWDSMWQGHGGVEGTPAGFKAPKYNIIIIKNSTEW